MPIKNGLMLFHRFKHRLIFVFVVFIFLIFFNSGLTLHWIIRQSLETEMGAKLAAVARAGSVQFDNSEIGYLMEGVGPRTEEYLREKLSRLMSATHVKRIFMFDLNGRSILDTESKIRRGTSQFNFRIYRSELDAIRDARSTHSVLFTGIDNQPTMTGYAPIFYDGRVVGGIGVDGSVMFLDAVRKIRNRLYLIGAIGMCGAVILGLMMARSILMVVP